MINLTAAVSCVCACVHCVTVHLCMCVCMHVRVCVSVCAPGSLSVPACIQVRVPICVLHAYACRCAFSWVPLAGRAAAKGRAAARHKVTTKPQEIFFSRVAAAATRAKHQFETPLSQHHYRNSAPSRVAASATRNFGPKRQNRHIFLVWSRPCGARRRRDSLYLSLCLSPWASACV